MTKGELDKIDFKMLDRLVKEGAVFFSSASHEMRASDMRRAGYVTGEMAVYSMTGGGKSMNFRTRYTITDKGRSTLPNGVAPGDAPKEGT